jgi:hypothetical protein
VKFISEKRENASKWTEERKAHKDGSENYKRLTEQIDLATKEVVDYQANIVKSHSGMLVGKVVKCPMDIEIPEAPKDETGKMIDSNFRFCISDLISGIILI